MKPCPFCASNNLDIEQYQVSKGRPSEHTEYIVTCMNCGAAGGSGLNRDDAKKMWDLRRQPENHA